jgi:hypothetical protein
MNQMDNAWINWIHYGASVRKGLSAAGMIFGGYYDPMRHIAVIDPANDAKG